MSRILHTLCPGLMACLMGERLKMLIERGEWIKKFICVTCLVCVFGVGTAYAEEVKTRQYFTVKGGVDKYHDLEIEKEEVAIETGLAIMGSVGSYLTDDWRVETEVSYRSSSGSWSGTEVTGSNVGAMLNGVYELDLHPNLRPYVIGGVGGSVYLWEYGGLDGYEWAFAYQGGGGLRYVINAAWALEVEYRFFGTPDVEIQVRQGSRTVTAAEIPNEHSSFLVGLSYQF